MEVGTNKCQYKFVREDGEEYMIDGEELRGP
jgi:hypothetical protein